MTAAAPTTHNTARQRAPQREDRLTWSRLVNSAAPALPAPTAIPLTIVMVLLLAVATLMLHMWPGEVGTVVAWSSTNVHNLNDHPVTAMVASIFVVPGNPMPELVILAAGFAVLEQALGTWRTAQIALTGHVVATLLTEYGTELGAHWHLLAAASAERQDVGSSYLMYAVLAAAAMSFRGPAQRAAVLIVVLCVLCPLVMSPGMTPTGHVLSVGIGAAMMTLRTRFEPPHLARMVHTPRVVHVKLRTSGSALPTRPVQRARACACRTPGVWPAPASAT